MLRAKRVYEGFSKSDGVRILVDRLWPRGLSKEKARLDFWLKDIAPSDELRKWFGHKPERWLEFKKKYLKELKNKKEMLEKIIKQAKKHNITLLYAAKDQLHNNALVLSKYLQKKM
ncbi:MAG: DUF488 domain-containing protein [Candidatus Babeliales bacterium]|jgi:uncharacterized protein YeaO (DUF488 family)